MTAPKEESQSRHELHVDKEYELSLETGRTKGVFLRKKDFVIVMSESRFPFRYSLCLFLIRGEREPRWVAIERIVTKDGDLPRRRGRGRPRNADSRAG